MVKTLFGSELRSILRVLISEFSFRLGILAGITVLAAVAEMLMVLGVVPLAAFVMVGDYNAFGGLYDRVGWALGISDFAEYIYFFSFIVLVGTASRVALLQYQGCLIRDIANYFGRLNIESLYGTSLEVFSGLSHGRIVASSTASIQLVIDNVITKLFHLLSSILIGLGILIALLTVNFLFTIISISLLGGVYFGIMFFAKNGLVQAGKELNSSHKKVHKELKVLKDGFIQSKLYGDSAKRISRYVEIDRKLRRAQYTIYVLGSVPRYLVEGGLLLLVCVGILAVYKFESSAAEYAGFLGAIGLGAIRLLPVVQQAYSSLAALGGASHAIVDLVENLGFPADELCSMPESSLQKGKASWVFRMNGCVVRRGLTDIHYPSSTLIAGKSLAITGSSGSGKSTLLEAILGLIPAKGMDPWLGEVSGQKGGVGYLGQTPLLMGSSIQELLDFWLIEDNPGIQLAYRAAGVKEDILLKQDIGEFGSSLSGGQRQRLALALALYRATELLVLDEPTSALDKKASVSIMQAVLAYCRRRRISVVCVTHDPHVASLFDSELRLGD